MRNGLNLLKFYAGVLAVFIIILLEIGECYAAVKQKQKPVPFSDLYGRKLCKKPEYVCSYIEKNISWDNFWANQEERALIMKLNRLNVPLRAGMVMAIPRELHKQLMDFSPFPEQIAAGEKVLVFDPALLAWAAYDSDGKLVKWGPALGGMDRCPDTWQRCRTVVGQFKVEIKGDKNSRSHIYPIACGGKKNPCASMPHFVGFYKCSRRKRMCFYGFHASEKMVGKHASHGCVRLFLDDAEWLNKNFSEIDTKVIIKKYPYPNKK